MSICPICMKEKYSEKRRLGNLAEDICEVFLVKAGYKILNRNYLKKWGELDIVAKKNGIVRFIEVKAQSTGVTREMVSHETGNIVSRWFSRKRFTPQSFKINVSRESDEDIGDDIRYRPEENVHAGKQKRMVRAIQSYIAEDKIGEDDEWEIDIMTVGFDFSQKTAIIKHIQNVIFDV